MVNGTTNYLGTANPFFLKGQRQRPCPCFHEAGRYFCVANCAKADPMECLGKREEDYTTKKKSDRMTVRTFYKQKIAGPKFVGVPLSEQHPRQLLYRKLRWQCPPKPVKEPTPYVTSLGSPVGVSASTFSLQFVHCNKYDLFAQGFATCLIAFAEQFLTPEFEWDSTIMNHILLEGQKLIQLSSLSITADNEQNKLEHEVENFDIRLPEEIAKRTFVLCNNCFHLDVSEAIAYGIIGTISKDCLSRIPQLHSSLKKFFQTFSTSCIVKVRNWYLLIWRRDERFFVFDCFGRSFEDNLKSSHTTDGVAILFCLRSLENVSHLICNLSGISAEDPFSLRLVKVEQLVPCIDKITRRPKHERTKDYKIINDNYATLLATKHLGSCLFGETRLRQSLPVALSVLIYSKLDPPAAWTTDILDQIIFAGNNFYKDWSKCDYSAEFHIKRVPSHIKFAQFNVEIEIIETLHTGMVVCSPNFRQMDIYFALRKSFKHKHNNLIIQIHNDYYALWKKNNYYYILDPYEHGCLEYTPFKTRIANNASLAVCRTLDTVCCLFTQVIMKPRQNDCYRIHVIRIVNVERIDEKSCKKDNATTLNENGEVHSRNESLVWDQEETLYYFDEEETALKASGICICEEQTEGEDIEETKPPDKKGEKQQASAEKQRLSAERRKSEKFDENVDYLMLDSPGHSELEFQLKDEELDIEKFLRLCKDAGKKDCKFSCMTDDGDDDDDHQEDDVDEDQALLNDFAKSQDEKAAEKAADGAAGGLDGAGAGGPGGAGGTGGGGDGDGDDDGGRGGGGGAGGGGKGGGKGKGGDGNGKGQSGGCAGDNVVDSKCQSGRDPCTCSLDSSLAEVCGDDIVPNPTSYPGMSSEPYDMVVVGSENGSYASLCNLIQVGFRCADRIFTMTPWGNFLVIKGTEKNSFFIFDGCTCNVDAFRYLDLRCGTAGLLHFNEIHDLIIYIKSKSKKCSKTRKTNAIDICKEFDCS